MRCNNEDRLLRPCNYPSGTPGRGVGFYEISGDRRVMVIQVMGRVFMDPLDDPFARVEEELSPIQLGREVDAVDLTLSGSEAAEEALGLVGLVVALVVHEVPEGVRDARVRGDLRLAVLLAAHTGEAARLRRELVQLVELIHAELDRRLRRSDVLVRSDLRSVGIAPATS